MRQVPLITPTGSVALGFVPAMQTVSLSKLQKFYDLNRKMKFSSHLFLHANEE